MLYAADNDDLFPLYENFGEALQVSSEAVLLCPLTQEPFEMNDWVAGKPQGRIENPGNVVLFFAGNKEGVFFRYTSQRAAAAFADGSARFFKEREANELTWEPTFAPKKP